ncbi:hypothetical protein HK104_007888, partial [Borealophlyctis nickersoniae]
MTTTTTTNNTRTLPALPGHTARYRVGILLRRYPITTIVTGYVLAITSVLLFISIPICEPTASGHEVIWWRYASFYFTGYHVTTAAIITIAVHIFLPWIWPLSNWDAVSLIIECLIPPTICNLVAWYYPIESNLVIRSKLWYAALTLLGLTPPIAAMLWRSWRLLKKWEKEGLERGGGFSREMPLKESSEKHLGGGGECGGIDEKVSVKHMAVIKSEVMLNNSSSQKVEDEKQPAAP